MSLASCVDRREEIIPGWDWASRAPLARRALCCARGGFTGREQDGLIGTGMRYFLDTEYNGFGGALISLALVPEFGDRELYLTLPLPEQIHPWVARNVVPYLHMVPEGLYHEMTRMEAADEIAHHLSGGDRPVIVADWPEDIALFCALLMPGPGDVAAVPTLDFTLLRVPGFSPAANSKVPHNALHDARALREHVMSSVG